jgi:hypothetical protein
MLLTHASVYYDDLDLKKKKIQSSLILSSRKIVFFGS